MNRAERRRYKKRTGIMLPAEIPEGSKVRFDFAAIKADKNYDKFTAKYLKFIADHVEDVFTVEYDPSMKDVRHHSLVQFREDTNDPKWLFNIAHLKVVKDG